MERREYNRIAVDLPVDYSVNLHARANDISESGIRIVTGKFMTRGTILFLVIYLPDTPINTIGEVCWSKSDVAGNIENGIKFFFLDNIQKQKLEAFIGYYQPDSLQLLKV